ncbi:MAG TPA: glycosyltransferase family 2 protein [Chloroflexota bacterium]|nr:glycosyltransferase family 2 protein [Chloroflexota bacterium]
MDALAEPLLQRLPDPSLALSLSIVVPVLDEEDSVGELHRQMTGALGTLGIEYEILFVDDGSRDGTFERLAALQAADSHVRVISLRRRFGKTAALVAGFKESSGSVVITMDGDLQDDPNEIPRFLGSLEEGNDLVVGWKRLRHDPASKTLPSKIFNAAVRTSSGIPIHDFNCGFKAYRREVLDDLRLYGDMHRFVPVMAHWKGYKVAEIEVNHRERQYGRSKFGAGRVISGMFDFVRVLFLTRYMQKPLQLFGGAGLVLFLTGVGCGVYLGILKFIAGESIGLSHLPLLFLTVMLILFGALLFAIGLVGEMQRHFGYRATEEYSVRVRLPPV